MYSSSWSNDLLAKNLELQSELSQLETAILKWIKKEDYQFGKFADSSMKDEMTIEFPPRPILTHTSLDVHEDEIEMSVLVEEHKDFNLQPTLDNLPAPTYSAYERALRRIRRTERPIGISESPYSILLIIYAFNFYGQGYLALISEQGTYENALECLPWCLLFIFLGFVARLIKAGVRRKREMCSSRWSNDLLGKNSELQSELSQLEAARLKRIKEEDNFSNGYVYFSLMLLCSILFVVIGYKFYPDAYVMALILFPIFISEIIFGVMGMLSQETDAERKWRLVVTYSIIIPFVPCYLLYCIAIILSWSCTLTLGVQAVTFFLTGLLSYNELSSEFLDGK